MDPTPELFIDTNDVRAWAYGQIRRPECLGDPMQPAAIVLCDQIESLVAENERLMGFIAALAEHATTMWPDTSCGTGYGGSAITVSAHLDAIETLLHSCLAGCTVTQAADEYAAMWPGTTRLDGPAGRSSIAGSDGRPLAKRVSHA